MKNNKSILGIIFLTIFIDLLGFGMILPLLPVWAEKFTSSESVIIGLSAAYSLSQFVFAPILGRLSDRIGRRPIILISLLGGGFSFLAMAFSPSILYLYIARTIQGLFTAGGLASAPALIADVTTGEERAKGMGVIGAAFGLGFIFGPWFGGELGKISPALPFYAAAGLCALNFVWAYVKLPETRKIRAAGSSADSFFSLGRLFEALKHPNLALLLLIFFINTLAFANLESTFTLFVQDHFHITNQKLVTAYTGRILGYVGIIAVIIQGGLIGRLTKRFGERSLLISGILLVAIGMSLVPMTRTIGALLMALTILSIGTGIGSPSIQSLISRSAAEEHMGGVLGISQGLGSLARFFGSLWGAFAFGKLGIAWPYWSGGGL
ncbi:MAG: MFS transporter, partial [Armatimonadota bacterium]